MPTCHPQVAGGSSGTLVLCCHRLEKRETAGTWRDRSQGCVNSRDSAPFPTDLDTRACPTEEVGGEARNTGFQVHFSTLRGSMSKEGGLTMTDLALPPSTKEKIKSKAVEPFPRLNYTFCTVSGFEPRALSSKSGLALDTGYSECSLGAAWELVRKMQALRPHRKPAEWGPAF